MKRKDAIAQAQKLGIDSEKLVFANINKSSDVWWFKIPVRDSAYRWVILLCDARRGKTRLHIFDTPAGFFRDNAHKFSRSNLSVGEVFNLRLSAEYGRLFQDVRDHGEGVQFSPFKKKTIML